MPPKDGATWITSVSFSGDGSLVAAGSASGEVLIWDMEEEDLYPQPTTIFSLDEAGIDTDGYEPKVQVWDVETDKLRFDVFGEAVGVTGLVFSPDGEAAIAQFINGFNLVWNAADGKLIGRQKGGSDQVHGLAYSADRQFMAVGTDEAQVALFDFSGDDDAPLRSPILLYNSGVSHQKKVPRISHDP